MPKRTWTPSQLKAIQATEGNVLVSAGAGSGKTSVLTQRIYELVASKKASLDNLLVLTFTNKAAQEMKQRVRQLIKEDPNTSNLSPLVEASSIMTFDAFSLELVKKYHYELGLPSDIAIMDPAIFEVEKKKIIDALIDDYAAKGDDLFKDLVYHYAIKDVSQIKDFILAADDLGDLQSDKAAFFKTYLDDHFSDEFIKNGIQRLFASIKDTLGDLCKQAESYSTAEQASVEVAFYSDLIASPTYDDLYAKVDVSKYPQKIRNVGTPEDAEFHKVLSKKYQTLKKSLLSGDSKTCQERYLITKPYIEKVLEIIAKLDERISAFKKKYAAYSFADIAEFARKAAKIPHINKTLKERYRYIMIDEYQDTNDLQESFIASFSNDNVFVVGDIKQSIYRFRNANPSIFQNKFDQYQRGQGGQLITLAENFRSRQSVVDDINRLFNPIMSRQIGGVDYKNGQALVYGNTSYLASETAANYHSELYRYQIPEGLSQAQSEASIIAEDIKKKIDSKFPVFDYASKSTRPCRFGDFAILLRKKTDFREFKKTFVDYQVPLETSSLGNVSDEDVIVFLRNIVKLTCLLANGKTPEKLPHLFVSLARNFVFDYSDELIYDLISSKEYVKEPFYELLLDHSQSLVKMNLVDAVNFFFSTFEVIEKLPKIKEVEANYERVESLLKLAKSLSRFDYSLPEFDAYFDSLDKYQVDFTVETSEKEPSSVQLMTIHASKGLEFPIVYVGGLASQFNLKDSSGAFLVSKMNGLLLPLTDAGESRSFLQLLSNKDEVVASISEELRLLYVALTRAKEKFILVDPIKDNEKTPISTSYVKRFSEFLALANLPTSMIKEVSISNTPKGKAKLADGEFELEFKSIEAIATHKEKKQASKAMLVPVDEANLRYGERLHRLLQLSDFKTKDVSFIKDEGEKKLIARVLSLPLFAQLENAKVFHEYSFQDQDDNLFGIIDLLIVYPDHIDLVDFKAKNIDDPAYPKQLSAYEGYLKKVFKGLEIHKFLLSIQEGRIKGVE